MIHRPFKTPAWTFLPALLLLGNFAQAQDWPTRPISMVVPYAAGGPVDTLAGS